MSFAPTSLSEASRGCGLPLTDAVPTPIFASKSACFSQRADFWLY